MKMLKRNNDKKHKTFKMFYKEHALAILKKSLVIFAYMGLLSWILFIAFQTKSLPTEKLFIHYAVLIGYTSFLFKLKLEPAGNA